MKRKGENVEAEKKRLNKILFRPVNFTENFETKNEECLTEIRQPAWVDEDDEIFAADSLTDTKCTNLYANSLKQKYINLMGTPKWAKLDTNVKNDSDEEDSEILRKVGHLHHGKKFGLRDGNLELKKFPRINSETGNEGPIIKGLQFHPSSSVALVGGQAGIVSLFTVGGEKNKKLHSIALPNFRLLNAHFTPDGSDAILASDKNHSYCVYNLVAASATLVQLPRKIIRPTVFEISPCGRYLAVADGFDEVHIVCAVSRELLRSLKQSSKVEAVTFSLDGNKLYSFGINGAVTVWNMLTLRAECRFVDVGCVTGSAIAVSPCGGLLATGSGEGIVNIYESNNLISSLPKPVKTIENLRTKITSLKFNSSSEILSLVSSVYPNAIKLVHIPSYHVFYNFPDQTANLHQIAAFSFSPNSGFMAFSNNKNTAFLYRLKYFKNY